MSRYYFDLCDGKRDRDETGTDLPSDTEAQREAAKLFAGMLLDDPDEFIADDDRSVCVRDDRGLTLFTISMLVTRTPASIAVKP